MSRAREEIEDDLETLARNVFAELSASQQDIAPDFAEALNAARAPLYMTADEKTCRWPDCTCYAVQGPQRCTRAFAVPQTFTDRR